MIPALKGETLRYLAFYRKDEQGAVYRSIGNLRTQLTAKHHKLLFAMNGGMYMENNAPPGLYIENGKTLAALNKRETATAIFTCSLTVFFI